VAAKFVRRGQIASVGSEGAVEGGATAIGALVLTYENTATKKRTTIGGA